jgi:hypothetical protein
MKKVLLTVAVMLCLPAMAAAQTEGRVSVGVTLTRVMPTDDGVDPVTTIGPLFRLNPRKGWGPAGGFNWYRSDLENPSGDSGDFARMTIRPLMAGVSYTIGTEKVLTSFSIIAGPSWNDIEFRDNFRNGPAGAGTAIEIENSLAIRPGVNVTFTVAPRWAVVAFGGYMWNRPDTFYRDTNGVEIRDRWKADAVSVSIAAVYSLF